ncbi:MAG: AAA family ATPase, partial [Ekhidna sp.]|nr:AAA family ATPase [Ekhidna sp.]
TGPKRILLITEGEEDCAAGWMMNRTMNRQADDTKYHKVNPHIVSLPSGAKGIEKVFMHHFEDLMKYDKIYWFGDNPLVDEDGSDALEVAVRVLGHERLHVAPYPDRKKDLCDIMKIDKCGPLATAAFAHMFFNMKPYQPADVVEGSEYTWDAVFKEPIVGYDIPFSSINETLKGFRLGEHTIILAPSGAGKSTFCRKIGHYMGRVHNWKIGSIYLEEQDTETVQGYAACELNIALDVIRGNPEMVSQEDRDRCMQMIAEDHIFLNHNGSIQPDVLMDKIRYMVAKGVKLIIFDHLTMAVNLEDDQRLALDTLMENIYKFVKLNDVHILSVIHLNRNSKVDFSRGGEINEGSIRGSAGVIQQSWNCIAIECDVQHPTYSNFRFIRILKCREVGSRAVGLIPGSYSYDYDTGAYTFDPNVSKEDLGSPEGGGTANVSMGAKSYDNKAC